VSLKKTKLGGVAEKELSSAEHIPYTCHIDPYTVVTENDDLLQVIKLEGISFQTVDNDLLNSFHEQRNNVLRNISKGQVSLWTTVVRKVVKRYPQGDFNNPFTVELNKKYKNKAMDLDFYRNDIYVAIIYRDIEDIQIMNGVKKLKKTIDDLSVDHSYFHKPLKELTDITQELVGGFGHYEPRRLKTYSHNGVIFSQVLEYLGQIVNSCYERIPLSRQDAKYILSNSRLSFGVEAGEIRMVNRSRYFGALGIKEYCGQTFPGMLDSLLTLPMEYILTQSFTFTNKQKTIENIQLQRNRLIASGDLSKSQIAELDDALDDLVSNKIVAGDHHLSLVPYADSISELEDKLADARSRLGESGMVLAREDVALEAAFWAQLPGNFSYRTRPSLITSRNFSGLSSFHNFPVGHISGNHWGDAVTLFKTQSGTPYYFSFHRYEKGMPPGNGAVVGPTGSGKTVAMGFILAMAEKFGGNRIFFDKDQGAAVMIRALGGIYSVIKKGVKTGFNPLQMEPTPINIEFLTSLFSAIAEQAGGAPLYSHEEREINSAICGVMRLPKSNRRLFNMLPFMDLTKEGGVAQRLSRWAGEGDRAWVFDNEFDSLSLNNHCLGFDMTEVLDDNALRTPIALYIIHRIKTLLDGTRTIINFDEGWKYARDPLLGPQLEDFYRTIRKQNGVIILGTNDAADVAGTEIGRLIMQQSQWQFFFPNPKAKRDEYIEGMGLTEKEYEVVRGLPEKSHQFLIKKGISSIVVKLDLAGMNEELNILSGTTETVATLEKIIDRLGSDPKDWLPEFNKYSRAS
jgi:type IV secretion system protein VirB4